MIAETGESALSLHRLFPFLLSFDRSMRIVEAGPVWSRVCPDVVVGATMDSLFRLVRPEAPLAWESLIARESTVLLLECRSIGLALRGQVASGTEGVLHFLGFPWITSVSQLQPLNLTLADFPAHVATPDMLFLLQAKDSALRDTNRLASEIAGQRAVIRQNEQRVRSIIDSAMDAVVSIDSSGLITDWNTQSERLFGWTKDEAIGKPLAETILPPALRSVHAEGMGHFLETGELRTLGRRVEVPAVDREGREFPVELSVTASGDDANPTFHAFVRDIRERKAAERELRASRERLNLAVDGAGIAIWDWNVETDEIVVNDRWYTMIGFKPGELRPSGATWGRLLHPEDRERVMKEIFMHLRGESQQFDAQFRLRARDDEWRWIQSFGRVVSRDAGGRALRVTGVQHDITRRKGSEIALAAQHAVTSALAEADDTETAIQRSLEAVVSILGWEVAGLWTVNPDSHSLECRFLQARDDEKAAPFLRETSRLRFGPGVGLPGRVWQAQKAEWIADLSKDDRFLRREAAAGSGIGCGVAIPVRVAGAISGVLDVYGHDRRRRDPEAEEVLLGLASQVGQFLERRRSEQALQQNEVRIRRILDTAMDAVITIDSEGRVSDWNSSAARMFGHEADEVVGRSLAETIIPPSLREAHRKGLATYLRTGQGNVIGRRVEVPALHRDGREFPVELTISHIEQGGSPQFAAFIRDITDRKRAETELAQAKEAAEVANEAKTRFLATMSHEIRTPLNPILGMTSLLLDANPTPEQRRHLDRIRQSGMLLLRQINEILDFSRIEAGRITLEEVPFDPREILSNIVDIFAVEAREKNLELATQVTGDIPGAVIGDPGRIQQVIANLVSNAIKFTEVGGVLVTLSADTAPEGRAFLLIRVHDTGIGIPEQTLRGIFDPFTQADASTTRRFGGSGLGLAIARELARQMGGDVSAQSDRAGSTFEVRVSVTPCASIPAQPQAAPALVVPRQSRARILVAEDNVANQEVVVLMLQRLGHSADVAADGEEAVAAFRRYPYDLVLMDCQMPGMDGFGATRVIRSLEQERARSPRPRTPIVAMTAFAVAGDRERCLDAGMDDYLSKPVQYEQLAETLARHLPEGGPVPAPLEVAESLPAAAIDDTVIARLRMLETPQRPLVARLVAIFLDKTPGTVESIRRCQTFGDLADMVRLAHDLKSESGNLGAKQLSSLCSTIQDAARSSDEATLRGAIANLPGEAEKAMRELRALCARPATKEE